VSDAVPNWASSDISKELPSIRNAGENTAVDFKESFPEQAHRLAKEIAAMASSGGGRIYIGINDNGDLYGINVSTGDERDDIAERAHSIARTVRPVPKLDIHFAVEGRLTVLVLDIPKQDFPAFYYDSRPYVRDKRRARPAEPEEVVELVWGHPSSEHKKEIERIQRKQLQDFVDHNRQLDQQSIV
jgi:predicted HTH transcriptional regulator